MKINRYILILVCSLALLSCTKDFIVKDIKKDMVNIIAPADHLSTPNNSITFWWDELDGAETYNLQIVAPGFNSVQQLLVDTNVTGNKFEYNFTPGTYQWRIKATNAGGSTAYNTRTLVIDTTSNLAFVTVSLVAPAANTVTASNNIVFSWNSVPTATRYDLEVTSVTTGSVSTMYNITTTSQAYSFSVVSGTEEAFKWRVIAYNGFSQTQNNPQRSFRIDKKAPLQPLGLVPNNYGGTYRDTIHLKWTRSATDVSYDVVELSADSLFSSLLGINPAANGTPITINSIYTYSGTPVQMWWRVKSVDSVGNVSPYNTSRRFYLQ